MNVGVQTTYTELANVLADLPFLLREARRARHLSLRATAREVGCSFNTITRIETGKGYTAEHAVDVLRWLDGGR